ncbi:DivIVA domain-containing protein [Halanaerobaculum tunisiense]
MTLTPEDIYNKEFSKSFSLWSYDDQEIVDFLDLVGTYYEEIIEENKQLEAEVERLEAKLEDCKQQQMEFQASLQETLDTAKETASSKEQEAERKADLIIQEAKGKADQIIAEAQDKAREEYRRYQELVESKRRFKVQFKSQLKSYLELLEDKETNIELLKEDIEEESEWSNE